MHSARIPSQEEVLQVFRRAGFHALTPLQSQLIPAVLRPRDLFVASGAGSGRTVGFMLPLLLGLRGAGPTPQALILAAAAEDIGKAGRAAARLGRIIRDAPAFVPLGDTEDARREQRRLEKGATIVAGTTGRVIDHLRRGSLSLGELAVVVMTAPAGPELADFTKDVQFIFAKIAERRQTILFSPAPLGEDSELVKLLRHPLVLGTGGGASGAGDAPRAAAASDHLYVPVETGRGPDGARALARLILGMRMRSVIVYHAPRTDGRAVADTLRSCGLRVGAAGGGRGLRERRESVGSESGPAPDVLLVAAGQTPAGAPAASPTHVVFYEWPVPRPGPGRIEPRAVVVALVDRDQERDISRLQDAIGVTMSKGQLPDDEEVLAGAIDRIVKRMKEEDVSELVALRSRIRRQVPLLQRPLFMAALLKAQLPPMIRAAAARPPAGASAAPARPGQQRQGPAGDTAARGPSREAGQHGAPGPGRGRFGRLEGTRHPEPAQTRADGLYAQLFVSIGRNRRVYARDLSALFTEKLSLGAGDIGGVRVFEKYSFVDIVPAKAEEAIARLSGTELKGRTITVNYANKKKDEKEGA